MSKVRGFWRSTPGGEGVNNIQISAKTVGGANLDTKTTAGVGADKGLFTLDVGYPGPMYVSGTNGGVTLMSSSRDVGFAGTFSLYDLPDLMRIFTDGVIDGKDGESRKRPGRKPSPTYDVNPIWRSQNPHCPQNDDQRTHFEDFEDFEDSEDAGRGAA